MHIYIQSFPLWTRKVPNFEQQKMEPDCSCNSHIYTLCHCFLQSFGKFFTKFYEGLWIHDNKTVWLTYRRVKIYLSPATRFVWYNYHGVIFKTVQDMLIIYITNPIFDRIPLDIPACSIGLGLHSNHVMSNTMATLAVHDL